MSIEAAAPKRTKLSVVASSTRKVGRRKTRAKQFHGSAGLIATRVAPAQLPGSAIVSAALARRDGHGISFASSAPHLTAPSGARSLQRSSGRSGQRASAEVPTGFSDAQGMAEQMRETAEMQASFNLTYLNLQQSIQQDTRQFNMISNIMKTKHDAAKNALNNMR